MQPLAGHQRGSVSALRCLTATDLPWTAPAPPSSCTANHAGDLKQHKTGRQKQRRRLPNTEQARRLPFSVLYTAIRQHQKHRTTWRTTDNHRNFSSGESTRRHARAIHVARGACGPRPRSGNACLVRWVGSWREGTVHELLDRGHTEVDSRHPGIAAPLGDLV